MDSKKLYSALYALTAKKGSHWPSLEGVRFDKGSIVASNAFAMVVLNTPYPPEWEGKILDKDGKEIKERPLNYKAVLPYDPQRTLRTSDYVKMQDLDELKTALNMMPKSPDTDGERIGIEIEGATFYPPLMLKVLKVFEVAEQVPEIFICVKGQGLDLRCIMLSDNGSIGIVMPLIILDGVESGRIIPMEEALLCGDLL